MIKRFLEIHFQLTRPTILKTETLRPTLSRIALKSILAIWSMILVTVVTPTPVNAETIKLVRDINRESLVYGFVDLSSIHTNKRSAFFVHQYGDDVNRLWYSDGESARAVVLPDDLTGRVDRILITTGRFLYFSLQDRETNVWSIVVMPAAADGHGAKNKLETRVR